MFYLLSKTNTLRKVSRTELDQFINLIQTAQQKQRTVFIVGNGGSASTASHWATDLGKGLHHRTGRGVKALSLADNTAWISAAANDIGYDSISQRAMISMRKNPCVLKFSGRTYKYDKKKSS